MERLQALITEALEKFPSEDIRELVARETGLTVEEVSKKMNEAAKAYADEFPAPSLYIEKKDEDVERIKSKLINGGDADDDGEYDTDNDRTVKAGQIKNEIDENKDKVITYKEAFIPVPSSSAGDISSDYLSRTLSDLTFEERTVKIGTTVSEVTPEGYLAITCLKPSKDMSDYITGTVDLNSEEFNTVGDLPEVGEVWWPDDTFIADGSVIFLAELPTAPQDEEPTDEDNN